MLIVEMDNSGMSIRIFKSLKRMTLLCLLVDSIIGDLHLSLSVVVSISYHSSY